MVSFWRGGWCGEFLGRGGGGWCGEFLEGGMVWCVSGGGGEGWCDEFLGGGDDVVGFWGEDGVVSL